jgi:hypothetical protein
MTSLLLCSALFCETTFNFQFKEEESLRQKLKKYDLEWIIIINQKTEVEVDLEDVRITVTYTY